MGFNKGGKLMEDLSTGYTWDEVPENLKKVALHLSNVLKIDKIEAYQMILEKMTEIMQEQINGTN